MDVSSDQEHDRTHLRDLLTSFMSGLVSQVSGGSETGGGFRIPKGLGTSLAATQLQFRDTPITKLRKPAPAHPSTTQTLLPPPFAAKDGQSLVYIATEPKTGKTVVAEIICWLFGAFLNDCDVRMQSQ
jgi:hypothetical protein